MKYGTALLWGFGLLMLPGTAFAAWGENWGEMVWGVPVSVPSVPGVGLVVLALGLSAMAAWVLRKRRVVLGALGPPVLLLLLVPLLIAPHITTWNGLTWYEFINGEVADAGEVNQNFSALTDALDVTVPNSFANSGIADANEINSNFETLKTAVDTFTNDLAAATSATETAAENGCTQGGGTWNAGMSTCTAASSYNCFVGGFCAALALDCPFCPDGPSGMLNVYVGHTPGTEPALGAGCNFAPGSWLWQIGVEAAPSSFVGAAQDGLDYVCER